MSNNLREQFPGIAKVDEAAQTAWILIQLWIILDLLVQSVRGWIKLLNVTDRSKWSTEQNTQAAKVLTVIGVLAPIVTLVMWMFSGLQWNSDTMDFDEVPSNPKWYKINVSVMVAVAVMFLGGVVAGIVAWMINMILRAIKVAK